MIDFNSILLFLIVLLISASFHEMMHAYVAYRLGDDLAHSRGRISLNPFVHIDPFLTIGLPAILLLLGQPPILAAKPVPINTSRIKGDDLGLAVVGVSGPLTNLALAFVFGAILQAFSLQGLASEVVQLFVLINVSLFVFNMIPIPPLDGSRLLYAFAPPSVQAFMRQIESFGMMGLIFILLIALPVISPIIDSVSNYILGVVI